jgi:outer membrane receptor protein involved in Fe transport
MRFTWMKGLAVLAVLLLAAPAFAQTTGRIEGRVVDNSGAAIPGVTVTATSPKLQGERSDVTAADGTFRLPSLPPGDYAVKAALEGMSTLEQTVNVGLSRSVSLEFKMSPAVSESIVVSEKGPVVDVRSSGSGVSVGSDVFQQIPVARDFYAVAQVAPGVGTDAVGTSIAGGTGAENQYIIEGLNTTGVELGDQGKTLNFEFIDEVEVKTGGLPAEYGRMTGGIINAITKSGGNTFTGDVFGYYEGGSLRSDNSTGPDRPATTTNIVDIDKKADYGVDVGGKIIKDKLWYFLAYDRVDQTNQTSVIQNLGPGAPPPGSKVPADITTDLYAGKLTWAVNPSNTITGSLFGDPRTRDGNVFAIQGPEITWKGTNDTGSDDYIARYDGVFGGSWVVEASAGRHQEKNTTSGAGTGAVEYIDQRVTPNILSNGFGFYQDQKFHRDVAKASVSKFVGSHEIKVGGDFEDVKATNENFNGGQGQRIYIPNSHVTTPQPQVYRHRFYIDDTAPGYVRNDPSTWTIAAPLSSEPHSKNTSAFAQDSFRVLSNLTLNLGFRLEQQQVFSRTGATAFKLNDNYSPRVGIVWDPTGAGRSKVFANFGRFYESVPMDINIRAFGGEIQCICNNFDPSPSNLTPDPGAKLSNSGNYFSLLGGSTEPVDPGLKGQYIDEYLLGYEYEVAPNFAVGIQGTYRNLGRAIEDFLTPGGDYFIANPGEGEFGKQVTFYDYYFYPGRPDIWSAPAPKAKRKYTAIQLTARKRFSNNWQLIASYVHSKLEGSYDGAFQVSTGQLDPNINSAYDYADFLVNSDGKLSLDQTNVFKVDGSYLVSKGALNGLNVGASAYYRSGYPLNAYGYSFAYQNWEFYLAPRGSVGTGPSDYELDLHLGYPIHFGNGKSVSLLVDVFNTLNRQAITRYDERYNEIADGFCGGIPASLCSNMGGINHQNGSIQPVGQLANPRATATNPDYLKKGVAFTAPRSIRAGVRFSF